MQCVVGFKHSATLAIASSTRDRFQSEMEFTMNTYVAIIGGKAVLTFRVVDDDQAHAMIDDQEGGMRSDLNVLVDADGGDQLIVALNALRPEA
jgi:hypothetical protein